MRCYRMTGEPFPAPEGWNVEADTCMTCSRTDEDPHDFARRELLAGKAPGCVCARGVSKNWMREEQQRLIEEGKLDPSVLAPSKKKATDDPEKLLAVKELLKADPTRTNKEIQDEAGAGQSVAKRAREELGLKPAALYAREKRDGEIGAAFNTEPSLSVGEVAKTFGVSTCTITTARKRLGLPDGRAGRRIKPAA